MLILEEGFMFADACWQIAWRTIGDLQKSMPWHDTLAKCQKLESNSGRLCALYMYVCLSA